jgi:mannobiose 2-epimerase
LEELAGQEINFVEHFQKEILQCWIPRAIDTVHGGFHENYAEDWSEAPDLSRSLVYHSRMIWLAAVGGESDAVEHGFTTLWEKFWDQDYGGFVWSVPLDGGVFDPEKHLYGNAFAVFAMAKAGKKSDADWAFQWLDLHAHDDEQGGYVETCWSDGEQNLSSDGKDSLGTPYGLKSMNTNLHIMEALIELYRLSGEERVKKRLQEVFDIFRTRFAQPDGSLNYYLTKELVPASDIDSYGHAMEAAFLMIEAAEALERDVKETWSLAKVMVDRTLTIGWDAEHCGMFNEGRFHKSAHDRNKVWWVQAESFNILRVMADQFGGQYSQFRDEQWQFIERHIIDSVYGGWQPCVRQDGSRIDGHVKSDAWTEGYHQGRAVIMSCGK